MKHYLLLLLALLVAAPSAWAAQQQVTTITSGTGTTGKTLKQYNDSDINPRLTAIQSNFNELYTGKANVSCFADASAFNACFVLDWPALVTRDSLGLDTDDNPSFASVHASGGNLAAANKQVTKAWQTGLSYTADVTSVIHGGQHYIATSNHTAGSTTEPGVGASWATVWKVASGSGGSFDETGDYDPTGTWDFSGATVTGISGGSQVWPAAGGVAVYGGSNAWGTSLTIGTGVGNLIQLGDDGDGNPVLPFKISYTDLADKPTIPTIPVIPSDVSDLTDTEGLLGGTGLPEGGTTNQIIVKTESGHAWIDLEDHPQIASLISAFNAAGLNAFTFTPDTPASYPHYVNSGTFNLDFTVTDSSASYAVSTVHWQVNSGGYGSNTLTNTSGNTWRVAQSGLTEAAYSYKLRATDDKAGTPNTGESSVFQVTVDLTNPVVDLTVGLVEE